MRIIVENRGADYCAFLEDSPKKWEAGKTIEEAVKKLHISHTSLLWNREVEIVYRNPFCSRGNKP